VDIAAAEAKERQRQPQKFSYNLWDSYFWYALLPKFVKAYKINTGEQSRMNGFC
jgi:hypothetical protein